MLTGTSITMWRMEYEASGWVNLCSKMGSSFATGSVWLL